MYKLNINFNINLFPLIPHLIQLQVKTKIIDHFVNKRFRYCLNSNTFFFLACNCGTLRISSMRWSNPLIQRLANYGL